MEDSNGKVIISLARYKQLENAEKQLEELEKSPNKTVILETSYNGRTSYIINPSEEDKVRVFNMVQQQEVHNRLRDEYYLLRGKCHDIVHKRIKFWHIGKLIEDII